MLQCSKPFSFILGSFLAIDKLMPCGSIVNKATGQVYRPAGKNRLEKKLSNIIYFLFTCLAIVIMTEI